MVNGRRCSAYSRSRVEAAPLGRRASHSDVLEQFIGYRVPPGGVGAKPMLDQMAEEVKDGVG